MRASTVSDSVGSLNGGDLRVLRRALERAERELDVGDVVPDQRELAEHRLEQAAGERPVDLGEAALLGRVVRRGAEERLERAEHERQLGAHQHLRVDRVDRRGRRRPSSPAAATARVDHVSWVEAMTSSSIGHAQLGRQARRRGAAEALERAAEAPLLVAGELRRVARS